MKSLTKFEKGQAIVLIAFAIAALFGLVALGLDGGHAFSDRRQAQNAADAAALAVARRYAQDQSTTLTEWTSIAQTTATTNGYDNNVPSRSVVVLGYRTATAAECPGFTPPPVGLVFQVDIDSYVPTWFGPVIGVSQVHNHVTSVSLSCPPYRDIAFFGNAIVALSEHDCQALKFSGSGTTTVTSTSSQGLYVHSDCYNQNGFEGTQNALYGGGSGSVVAPAVNVVGGVYNRNMFAPTYVNVQVPRIIQKYTWPKVDSEGVCPASTSDASYASSDTLNPGVYPGSNPDFRHESRFPPNNVTHLNPGIYCVDITTSLSGSAQLSGDGIAIVQRAGSIGITGGDVNVSAPLTGPLAGMLFYQPESNTEPGNVAGGGNSSYNGSIVAPGAGMTINGGSSTTGPFQTQVIANTIEITGSASLVINFDGAHQYHPPVDAVIKLLR
jgi:hypothetical protein